jgi:5'-nucleotidase
LARELLALSPGHIPSSKIASTHGVDILLGGHDHFYFASKGVTSWENYDVNKDAWDPRGTRGDVLVIKSGTDFRDLTSIDLELEDVPETTDGAVRRKLVKSIKGMEFEKPFWRVLRCNFRTTDCRPSQECPSLKHSRRPCSPSLNPSPPR